MTDKATQPEANGPIPSKPSRAGSEAPGVEDESLRADAAALSHHLVRFNSSVGKSALSARLQKLQTRLIERLRVCKAAVDSVPQGAAMELLESSRMFEAALTSVSDEQKAFAKVPRISGAHGPLPRILHIAERYMAAVDGIWSEHPLLVYAASLQQHQPLLLQEVLLLGSSLRLAQLEFLLDRADEFFASDASPIECSPFPTLIYSLRRMEQTDWRDLVEEIVVFNKILADDSAGAFCAMDEESRANYRIRIAELARRADLNEVETASKAVFMARSATAHPPADPRMARRVSHVGYYLFEEGLPSFCHEIGYHPPPMARIRTFIRGHNEHIYIPWDLRSFDVAHCSVHRTFGSPP